MRRVLSILILFLSVYVPMAGYAQVTTGAITGTVKSTSGEALAGATVSAVHQPTGSKYTTVTKANGQFTLPNLRVGGPYTVTITYQGYADGVYNDLTVTLGTPVSVDASLEIASKTLGEVKVTAARKGAIISSQRTGASTYISSRLMQSLPTINRSVQDFARLTPQVSPIRSASDGSSMGLSFAGQNNRYNQFTIDGANATDGFGLTASGTNGGQANINPVSIEAIQEMQIVLSPYDVTQGGFTGGGINAVTKSGTNTLHGTAYGTYQNEGYVGKSASYNSKITRNKYADFKNYTYGGNLGGAIIKNKLFFFVNAERYERTTPLPYDPTVAGSGSKFNVDTLNALRQSIIKNWGWDPGSFGEITKKNQSTSLFGRIDWNINDRTTLTLRHSYVKGSNDILSRTATSMVFSNSGYSFANTTNSTVLELNSNFSSSSSNVLRLTFNAIRDSRATAPFTSLTINNYDATQKASLQYNIGSDYSSQVNSLNQNIFSLTDNFTLYKGKHTITLGTNNEFFSSLNYFLQNYNGSYQYGASNATTTNNIANFENNVKGSLYSYYAGFSTSSDPNDKAPAKLRAAQFGVYAQDVWAASDRFKLTYGLRIDMPVYFKKPAANNNFDTTAYFSNFDVKTEQMPKAMPLFSPRVGFNWDVNGNGRTQLRGGAGLFTGRVPFVWISNQMSNTGVASLAYTASTGDLANISFNFDPSKPHYGAYIPGNGTPTVINVIDKKFKYPQVFRSNLAIDQKLPWWGLVGTVEAVFTKTVNNVNYQDLNVGYFPDGTVKLGSTTRPLYTAKVNSKFTNVLEITNTSKGYGYNFTAQIQKPYSKGWSGSIAYTFGHSTSLSDLTSSVALSNWRYAYSTNGMNNLDLATSNFDLGSRVVGFISKEFRYAKRFATTFTLIYSGQSGQTFSYLYSRTITGDDNQANTMAYIPKNFTEANFVDIKNGATASQQWSDFQTFVLNNKYLKDHIGQNTTRNGDRMPFESHFDLRIAEQIGLVKGHKLEIMLDILNLSNLLNKDWGWSYNLSNQYVSLFTVQSSGAQTVNGVAVANPTAANPALQFNINSMNNIKGTYRPYYVSDFTSRWNSQIGLRYSF